VIVLIIFIQYVKLVGEPIHLTVGVFFPQLYMVVKTLIRPLNAVLLLLAVEGEEAVAEEGNRLHPVLLIAVPV
jgi:hypothetical protein